MPFPVFGSYVLSITTSIGVSLGPAAQGNQNIHKSEKTRLRKHIKKVDQAEYSKHINWLNKLQEFPEGMW